MNKIDSGYEVVVIKGEDRGSTFPLEYREIHLGRRLGDAESQWLYFTEPTVSRHHASLVWDESHRQYWLHHKSSTNPTLVNGKPVKRCPLTNDDVVQVGLLVFRVSFVGRGKTRAPQAQPWTASAATAAQPASASSPLPAVPDHASVDGDDSDDPSHVASGMSLVTTRGPDVGSTYALDQPVLVLGRRDGLGDLRGVNCILLNDDGLPREQVMFAWNAREKTYGIFQAETSTLPTRITRQLGGTAQTIQLDAARQTLLRANDVITFGDTVMRVCREGEAVSSEAERPGRASERPVTRPEVTPHRVGAATMIRAADRGASRAPAPALSARSTTPPAAPSLARGPRAAAAPRLTGPATGRIEDSTPPAAPPVPVRPTPPPQTPTRQTPPSQAPVRPTPPPQTPTRQTPPSQTPVRPTPPSQVPAQPTPRPASSRPSTNGASNAPSGNAARVREVPTAAPSRSPSRPQADSGSTRTTDTPSHIEAVEPTPPPPPLPRLHDVADPGQTASWNDPPGALGPADATTMLRFPALDVDFIRSLPTGPPVTPPRRPGAERPVPGTPETPAGETESALLPAPSGDHETPAMAPPAPLAPSKGKALLPAAPASLKTTPEPRLEARPNRRADETLEGAAEQALRSRGDGARTVHTLTPGFGLVAAPGLPEGYVPPELRDDEEDEEDDAADFGRTFTWRYRADFILGFVEGRNRGQRVELLTSQLEDGQRISLGSRGARLNEIEVDDTSVANVQGTIAYRGGRFTIVNEGDRTNLLLNEMALEPGTEMLLKTGDRIQTGKTAMIFLERAVIGVLARYELKVVAGIPDECGKSFDLWREVVVIGRLKTSDVALADAEISRKHLAITLRAGRFYLTHLSASTATFINGVSLPRGKDRLLNEGDRIQLSDHTTLQFRARPQPQ